jgi:addiction module HigA family antidote
LLTTTDKIEPIHPGEVLMEDFIEGFGITQNKLAVSIGVPPRRINEIVHGKRGITADTALRLAKYFGTSAEFWINLQGHYELETSSELTQVLQKTTQQTRGTRCHVHGSSAICTPF